MAEDVYRTIEAPAEAACRERSSKFLSYIYPVCTEEEIRERLEVLRKRYFDATHHCYAWRLGPHGETFRANDDGEPRERPASRSSDSCSRTSSRSVWWLWSATSAARNSGSRG